MMEVQKAGGFQRKMGWLAALVLLVMLVSILFFPFMRGNNIGKVYGKVFEKQIYREYEYSSSEDYYYPSGTDIYASDDDDDYDDDYDDDDYDDDDEFDDSEYRASAEKEDRKIRRDVKHIEELGGSLTFADEVSLLAKYIKYVVRASEEELIGFRYSFVMTAFVLVAAAAMAAYLLSALIITLVNLLKNKADMDKIQRRLCRSLFFLLPLLIAVSWQHSLTIKCLTGSGYFYGSSINSGIHLGMGCVLPCILILVYLLLYWGAHIHRNLSGENGARPAERFVFSRLVSFIMMAAAGCALLLNFGTALYTVTGKVSCSDLAAESAYSSSAVSYEHENYELERENDKDEDESWWNTKDRKEERQFEKNSDIYNIRTAAGFFILAGIMITVQVLCSVNKATYGNTGSVRHRIWAGVNVAVYLAACVLLARSNTLEWKLLEKRASEAEKGFIASPVIGWVLIALIALNAFIIAADIWRKYMNRAFDRREEISVPDESPDVL